MRRARDAAVFDTVHIAAYGTVAKTVAGRLADVSAHYRQGEPEPRFTGSFGSLNVRVSPRRTLVRGSVTKFVGCGVPSRADVEEAIGRICDTLDVAPETAEVWRIDTYADLALTEPPSAYLPLLVTSPRLQRVEHAGTSVGFQCARRDVRFYDRAARKERAYESRGGPLRFEMACKKELARQFGGAVSGRRLSDPALWNLAVDKWLAAYAAVEKARQALPFDAGGVALTRALALGGLAAYGLGFVLDGVEQEYRSGRISRRAWQERRRQVLGIASDSRFTRPPARLLELNAAVKASGEQMRALAAT